jgi:hypothetical protein
LYDMISAGTVMMCPMDDLIRNETSYKFWLLR